MAPEQQLEPWRDTTVYEQRAKRHYRDLPFHGFPHALDTREGVRRLIQEAIDFGEPIDAEEAEDAEIAAIYHDAGYHIPLHVHGFRSKEVFSGYIAAIEQQSLGMPHYRIARMVNFIFGTEMNVKPIGKGGRALRQSDLWVPANAPPMTVIKRTIDLFNEDAILKREYDHPGEIKEDLISFAIGSFSVMRTYNQDDVSLGQFDTEDNGLSRFANSLDKNMQCFLPPNIDRILRTLKVLPPKIED